jgi:hypothetical protein
MYVCFKVFRYRRVSNIVRLCKRANANETNTSLTNLKEQEAGSVFICG